jgi:hypothetical protein
MRSWSSAGRSENLGKVVARRMVVVEVLFRLLSQSVAVVSDSQIGVEEDDDWLELAIMDCMSDKGHTWSLKRQECKSSQ